jgi:hypothetical protein
MPLPTSWPRVWAAWESSLLPGMWAVQKSVRSVALRCTAGNVALAFVDGLEESTAVVAHSSQSEYRPHVEVRDETLSVLQTVSPLSFARQTARINTLVLVPPGLRSVELALTAGEVWLFGDINAPPMDSVKASCLAGDVTLIDVLATTVSAHNKLGDVNLHWDTGETSGPRMPTASVAVSGRTVLGDVRLGVSGPAAASPAWLQTTSPVHLVATDDSRVSGSAKRLKWMRGTGRDFFEVEE